MQAAAQMPAWRIEPPRRCFQRQTSSMKSREPAMTAPIGAPSPFEKSIQAESHPAAMSRALMPVAPQAFGSRAPSMWVANPTRFGDLHDRIEIGFLPDRAAADIGRLFDADDGLRRLVARARMKRCSKGIGRELPARARQRRNLESAERGMGAAFAGEDVRGLMRQDLVAGAAMHQGRGDVAHGAGGHEHRGLLAEQIGDAFAQHIHRRIVADLLVAHFGARHRFAHAGRRAGLGVRQQVDANRWLCRIARGRRDHGGFSFVTSRRAGRDDSLRQKERPRQNRGP